MTTQQPVSLPVLVAHGHTVDLITLRAALITWDRLNLRVFPWRETTNPFHIMIAELMLRRTQARQVVAIYQDFTARYPDAAALAVAPEQEVASVLYSLGLAWRVPAFQQIARTLVQEHQGKVPATYEILLTLPGVGEYVASAICCFAFSQSISIIDTNTVRIVGRLFSFPTHAESRRRKPVRDLLNAMVDPTNPRAYNYAMLDLAAAVCTPVNPHCASCPLLDNCTTGKERIACQNG